MSRRKPSRTKSDRQAAFLEALSTGVGVREAAKAAGVGCSTAYEWRKCDMSFADEWEAAYGSGTDVLAQEATRRAVDGVPKPVFYNGKKVGEVREYSDTLLIFLLKARDPRQYCDKARTLAIQWQREEEAAQRGVADPTAHVNALEAIAALERIAATKVAEAETTFFSS